MIFLLKRRITMGKLIKWVMLLISCSVLFGKGELPSDFVMIVSILMFLGKELVRFRAEFFVLHPRGVLAYVGG